MHKLASLAALAAVVGLSSLSFAQAEPAVTLKVGDPAPKLDVGKWLKGEAVTEFKPGTVYVMEFWATWCGPCIQAIPHVTSLQQKHGEKVVMIGVNVWERDESKVEPFVTKMGEKMGYHVVMDNKAEAEEGAMARTWLAAAGQNGIPCSIIVDQAGKVAWIGHPMGMDEPLEQIIAGKFDPKAAAERAAKQEAAQAKFSEAMSKGDIDGAMKILDELAAEDKEIADQLPTIKFRVYLQAKKYDLAYAQGDAIFEKFKDKPDQLNQTAWMIATGRGIEQRDLKLARKFAERAVEVDARKTPDYLDTLARVLFDAGEIEPAIKTQTEAVEKAEGESKTEMQASLEKYIKARK
jgi:thiol-disulfide isomerase/thioredoxin